MSFALPAVINDFLVILLSILVEGIPFILVGSILSGFLEYWITPDRIVSMLPKNKMGRFITMSSMGNVLPVCECGNIPLARRLILKNVPSYLALTFLLAAPVFNPIVIVSTLSAFPNDASILFYRILFTLIIAIGVGYIFSFLQEREVLIENLAQQRAHHHHHHDHDHSGGRFRNLLALVKKEFLEMTGIFLFGATIASFIQLMLPQDFVFAFQQYEWLSILAMMALGFIISICSNVDAFFALAYAQIFPTSSVLAFLVFGPMIDIKAIPMFRTIFTWKAVGFLGALVAVMTFLLTYSYFLFT